MRRLALLPLFLAACSHVEVTPSGGATAQAKPAGCAVEFIRTKAPDRPYDELGTLHWEGSGRGAAAAQEEIRAKACTLGADAVIVTRDYVPYTQNTAGFMTATAIRYRPPAGQ